jgi:hypothetical protein
MKLEFAHLSLSAQNTASALSLYISYIFAEHEVNHNGLTTTEKQKDVNLYNESSSDVPQANTNGKREAAHVGTISCE